MRDKHPTPGEQLGADLTATDELDVELSDEAGADLVDEVGREADAGLGRDLEEDLEVDGGGSNACAPYLVRQMSCLGSRTPGVKDTPFLGSVWGAKEAEERLPPGCFVYARDLHASKHHRYTRSLPRFRPPGG